MIYILVLVHVFFTLRLHFVQRHIFCGIKYSLKPSSSQNGIGTYKAFAAALGTTIGPGNITGVAVAISLGGAGAVFWMWLCGVIAMSTKYAESFLSLRFKRNIGGTMVLLSRLGHPYIAIFWSIMCAIGGLFMGAAVPSNSLASALDAPRWTVGALLALFIVFTITLGLSGIADICSFVVPVMALGFTVFCLVVTAVFYKNLPQVFSDMLKGAFLPSAFVGGGLGSALKQGITRGLYSNESGLGTGALLAAESGDDNLCMSSLAAMSTTFWDTVVMCALTGIMLLSSGAQKGMSPTLMLKTAFGTLPFGNAFLCLSMSVFVYATVIGWYYIAKLSLSYLTKKTAFYDFFYIALVFFGSVFPQKAVWKIADTINFCLLLPSLFAILCLSDKIMLYIKDN